MNVTWPSGLGSVLAVIVLILCIVLMVVGRMDAQTGGLIATLAVARLL